VTLDGPFPSVAAWCGKLTDATCEVNPASSGARIQGAHEVTAPSPYKQVLAFVVWHGDSSLGDCAIAVQLHAGWFAARVVEGCSEGEFRKPETRSLSVENGLVRWSMQVDIAERGDDMEWMDKDPEPHEISCRVPPASYAPGASAMPRVR
jgi:hypothetical protein